MQQINEIDSRDMEALGWDDDFWEEIGLGDLVDSHHSKIGMLLVDLINYLCVFINKNWYGLFYLKCYINAFLTIGCI